MNQVELSIYRVRKYIIKEYVCSLHSINMAFMAPPKKKAKKDSKGTQFNNDWLKVDEYKLWLTKTNEYTASCRTCSVNFTVMHEGEKAIKDHKKTKKHLRNWNASTESQSISLFCVDQNPITTDYKETVIEVAKVYHNVKHHLSYRSFDCGLKLDKVLFKEDKISKKISCGRTKAGAIVRKVLGPKSIELVVNELLGDGDNGKYFSISSDASNRGVCF